MGMTKKEIAEYEKAQKKAKKLGLVEFFFASSFDDYQIEFCVGSVEALAAKIGLSPADTEFFSTKGGATFHAVNHGCLIWLPKFEGTEEDFGALFHEITHASVHRFESNGMLKGTVNAKNVNKGKMSYNETLAMSVGEIGTGLLKSFWENAK